MGSFLAPAPASDVVPRCLASRCSAAHCVPAISEASLGAAEELNRAGYPASQADVAAACCSASASCCSAARADDADPDPGPDPDPDPEALLTNPCVVAAMAASPGTWDGSGGMPPCC